MVEKAVNCPNCGANMGTTPDGEHLRAGKGSILKGYAAELHMTEGLIPVEVEGHGAMDVTGEIALAAFTFHPGYDGPFPATEFVSFDVNINFTLEFGGAQTLSATVVAPQAVPEPATLLLFGTGLAAVVVKARGKRRDRTRTHA
jgi:hypothetical protein